MTDSNDALPVDPADARLAALAETATAYARAARAENTQRAYESDWKQFSAWLRREGLDALPPDPQTVGLYLAAAAGRGVAAATLERRLSGIVWRYRQMGEKLDSADRHIASVLAGIRRVHGRPPAQKEAIFADELLRCWRRWRWICAACATAPFSRWALPAGCAVRKSSGSTAAPNKTEDGSGWIEITPGAEGGALLTIQGKTGWREVEVGRGAREDTCPVALLETWMRMGRVHSGPLFRAIARRNGGVSAERLTDRHVARLVQKCALAAGLRPELTESRTQEGFRRSFAARRAGVFGARGGSACAASSGSCVRGNDAALSAQARALQGQSDPRCGTVSARRSEKRKYIGRPLTELRRRPR